MCIVNLLCSMLFGGWSSLHDEIFAGKENYARGVTFAQRVILQ